MSCISSKLKRYPLPNNKSTITGACIVTALNQKAQRHVSVPRNWPENNTGGDDFARYAIGHGSVAVSVSSKRQRFASRVSNVVPARGVYIRHVVWRHPFVGIVTSLCSDGRHCLYTVKVCLNPRLHVAAVSWPAACKTTVRLCIYLFIAQYWTKIIRRAIRDDNVTAGHSINHKRSPDVMVYLK